MKNRTEPTEANIIASVECLVNATCGPTPDHVKAAVNTLERHVEETYASGQRGYPDDEIRERETLLDFVIDQR